MNDDVGLHLAGEAAKRGLLGRLPSSERLVSEVDAWFAAEARDTLRSSTRSVDEAGVARLQVALHPAAAAVRIQAHDPARVTVDANTSSVGPGYHTYLAHLLRRMGTDLAISWTSPDGTPAAAGRADPSPDSNDAATGAKGTFEAGDRASIERAMLIWLRDALTFVRQARDRGETGLHLSLPEGTRFTFDGALATALGPRDDSWLEAALRQPATAIDVWPWWSDATDGRYLLNRALCLMWTEVRWRSPAPEERALLDEVLGDLRRAQALEPALPFPWREWAELLKFRGGSDPRDERIVQRAAEDDDRAPIGYRRRPVTLVHEGWSVTVPGSFGERRTDEELWAGEARRSLTMAAVGTGADGVRMPPELFLARVAGHLGTNVIHHRRGPLVGKARLSVESSSGVEEAVLEGYSAVLGSGAVIRIVLEDPGDWEWALETWRSLDHA